MYKILVEMALSKQGMNEKVPKALTEKGKPLAIPHFTSLFPSYKILLDELSSTKHWASMHAL